MILIKSALLLATLPLAATNMLRNKPRLAAGDPARNQSAARLLRLFVGSEAALVIGAVFATALLSSLAPPPPAFARENSALARVGPGPATSTVHVGSYVVKLDVSPNEATPENAFQLELTKGGKPVQNAEVTVAFNMLDMQMPQRGVRPGRDEPGCLHPQCSATRHGRALGPDLRRDAEDGPAFRRDDRRPGKRMRNFPPRVILLCAFVALAAGTAAAIIAILVLRTVL